MTSDRSGRLSLGLAALMFLAGGAGLVLAPAGQRVAVHFDADGLADGWAGPGFAFFMLPVIALALVGLQRALPHLDPRGANLRRSARAVGTIWLAVMLVLALAQGWIVASALGMTHAVPGLTLALTGGFYVVIGNVMGKLRWNTTVGIRTPWTLGDERVWDRTHRFGGRLFVACGALLLLALAAADVRAQPTLAIIAATLVAAGGSIGKSWLEWRRRDAA